MPVLHVDVAQRQVEVGDGDVGQVAALGHGAEGRAGEERPRQAVVDRLVHARAVAAGLPMPT